MKKNRPAWELTVICKKEIRETLEDIIFRETTTIGVREFPSVMRVILKREDAFIRTIGVRQEFAQGIGILECARVQRLEAPTLIDLRHLTDDAPLGDQVAAAPVGKASRVAGLGAGGGSVGRVGHARSLEGRGARF